MSLKIGVIGIGHLGTFHARNIAASPLMELSGVYDVNEELLESKIAEFGTEKLTHEALIACSDALVIATPTPSHYDLVVECINKNKHVFVEKPVCAHSSEALKLMEMIEGKDLCIQVGHIERFNPAFTSVSKHINAPRFVEGHRLAIFNPRGTDVSVVHDLMIHDLDLILHLIKSPIAEIKANGVALLRDAHDIVNARIEFENKAVVNLTASRVSLKNMRKLRLFQSDAYLSIDFLEKSNQLIKLQEEADVNWEGLEKLELPIDDKNRILGVMNKSYKEANPIRAELESFVRCIENKLKPDVSLQDAYKALHLAEEIINAIED